MPDLNSLLKSANISTDAVPAKKKFSRGIRPDHVARGEVLEVSDPNGAEFISATQNKGVANDPQTGSKEVAKEVANDPQTGSKEVAESSSTLPTILKTGSKRVAKRVAEGVANDPQTGSKRVANGDFDTLIGKEKTVLLFMAEDCRINGSLVTCPLTRERIAEILNTTSNRAKNVIFRLHEKHVISTAESKTGRGGWTKFRLEKTVFQKALIQLTGSKGVSNDPQTGSKGVAKRVANRVAELPIVVVPNSLSLKTTTTETSNGDAPCFVIPNELSGMVSRRQLAQFVLDEKISEYELQMSLDAFAFDLKNKLVSTKHTANPVGLLIGAIKNNGGYNSQKFAEALKTEMKTLLSSQQTLEDSISEAKRGEGWAKYQEIKNSSPEAFQALVAKYEKQGLKGDLLEEFGFLEFQEQESLKKTEKLNPLSP